MKENEREYVCIRERKRDRERRETDTALKMHKRRRCLNSVWALFHAFGQYQLCSFVP